MTLATLLAASHHARLAGVHDLPYSDALRFALRRVLYTDDHAEVRAAAARRLAPMPDVEPWLLDALPDSSPLVRDAILRALSRAGTTASIPHLRRLVEEDRMWWVRRGAIYALAAIAGAAEVATFTRALADPFWRVRHAAVKVLAVLGAASPALRDEVIASSTDITTLAFLRASWGPVALEAPQRAVASTSLPLPLLDPDPAVVTARLLAADFPPLALVELLCDPHVPLRSLAVHRIATSGDHEALVAALDWLEEPRIPHVVDTVTSLLDSLGDLAADLATLALSPDRLERRGAARWAITWTVATRYEALFPAALARARDDAALRIHALRLTPSVELLTWAADPFLVDAVALELHERRRPDAHDILLDLDGTHHPRIRALQLDARARRGDFAAVARGLADPHHGPRAVAARWLSRSSGDRVGASPAHEVAAHEVAAPEIAVPEVAAHHLPKSAGNQVGASRDPAIDLDVGNGLARELDVAVAALANDPDPAVREAALTPRNAAAVFLGEADPFVRRAAISIVLDDAPPALVHAALTDADPWIRARACALPLVDAAAIARVLGLLAERDDMVRSAAIEALSLAGGRIDEHVRSIADDATHRDVVRRLARAWLARELEGLAATVDARPEEMVSPLSGDRHQEMVSPVSGDHYQEMVSPFFADHDQERVSPLSVGTHDQKLVSPCFEDHDQKMVSAFSEREASAEGMVSAFSGDSDQKMVSPFSAGNEKMVSPFFAGNDTGRAAIERRPFGRAGFEVAPLAISGAYDLSPRGLAAAEAAGVDLYFWEPGYDVLGRFLRGRDRLRVMTGSYHADAPSVRADVERALRKLRRETLDAFLLFWTRSPARIDDEAYRVLEDLKREGKIRAIGFSTHHRELARAAIERAETPWDVVMIRHSAAHPGIEHALLPTARETRTAIVTFSALCYGRMLSGPGAPAASECYRYSLAQAGVTACISAPRRHRELVENLAALREPGLPIERIAELREHGRGVHAESARFNTLVRQPTRDAAAAAREMLAQALPPEDSAVRVRLPRPSDAKRSRARLGSIRRGR
jgi:diketogulonate reductase-like aldo/keto reductase/HEAT repeat protein